MARKDIGIVLNRDNRNAINHNFIELYKGRSDYSAKLNQVEQNMSDKMDNFIEDTSNAALDKVVDNAKLDWLNPVDSYDKLPKDAKKGNTVMTRDNGYVYRFDGEQWIEIQEIDVGPVNELDSRLSQQLAETATDILGRGANPVASFGADDTGTIDATQAIVNAFTLNRHVTLPPGIFLISKLDIPGGCILSMSGKTTTILKKSANGYMVKLGKQSKILNGGFDGQRSLYTGAGIVIDDGSNTPTRINQGHQRIIGCSFDNMDGYHIEYTVANKGWMSRAVECDFGETNADAAVKWPDETTNGGNRYILDCYSSKPIVNVGGCDNGIIAFNTVGGAGATEEGIIFPTETLNVPNKIIVIGNRFALANGSIRVRGNDHSFSDNIFSGNFIFEVDATNCKYSNTNTIAGSSTFTSSNGSNDIFGVTGSFIPEWTSSTTAPSYGNSVVTAFYRWEGRKISVSVQITFGSTTNFGVGTWRFGLPFIFPGMPTKRFSGSVITSKGNTGTIYGTPSSGYITLYRNDIVGIFGATSPITWQSGDVLIFDYEYSLKS